MADEKKKEETPKEEPKKQEEAPVEEKKEVKEEPKEEKEPKERTKEQFEKLKGSNKELKEERDEYKEKYTSVVDSLKPKEVPQEAPVQEEKIKDVPSAQQYQNLDQKQVDDVFGGMIDEQGYVDANKLLNTLKTLDQKAVQAEERARKAEQKVEQTVRHQRDFEEDSKVREVHEKYPQIDPNNDDFNPELFDRVRNELIGQMMEGKEDFMEATEKWYNRLYKEEEMATKKEKQEQQEKEEAKAQINATTPQSTTMSGYYKDTEHDALIEGTQSGKKGALAERLKRSGY